MSEQKAASSTNKASGFVRNGPDRLQKVFLYLILVNWLVAVLVVMKLPSLSLFSSLVAGGSVIALQLTLLQLAKLRARRAGDGYLLYPITACTILMVFVITGFVMFY
ncbi:hypothetical protein [Ferrimonas aestuarii]|uniref:Uncharacterized protein n=1 Tax=Ferrimonas aestuarii TaxID=2569539 RepID=A0A4U1BQ24_9GAMM|nr:hypothetical protein [Ferrimonas aestuarii]TKB54598.1 hypothetical protein FCL42_12360 [Ferrimonas aestuarii]